MYVVDVLPLAKNAPPGTLSYRSDTELAAGAMVMVPLRRTQVPGIVVASEPVKDAKASLKAAGYALSGKVGERVGSLPKFLIQVAEETARWHAASLGATLGALVGEVVRSLEAPSFKTPVGSTHSVERVEDSIGGRKHAYQEILATTSSKGGTVLLVVSTLAELAYWKRELEAYHPLVISGSVTGMRRKALLEKACTQPQMLVMTTPQFAFLPLSSLSALIIERIGAAGFRLYERPYLDMRIALIAYARACQVPILCGDYPLPLEYREESQKRPARPPVLEILDVSLTGDSQLEKSSERTREPWAAIPKPVVERIRTVVEGGGRVALLAARKQYAPVVVCRDCGHTLRDERGLTFSFSKLRGQPVFRTSDGKSVLPADISCPQCESWNLLPLGVGVERVEEEVRAAFPGVPLVMFDPTRVRTPDAARRQLEPLEKPGGVVVGTESMIPWLLVAAEPLALAVIVSADTLLALPFWRARERFLRLTYLLAESAKETMVCTRMPEDAAIAALRDASIESFLQEERALRRQLGYPPFGTLLSLTVEGTRPSLTRYEAQVREAVGGEYAALLIALPERFSGGTTWSRMFVLTLPEGVWPDDELSQRLAGLSLSARIAIDPESLW